MKKPLSPKTLERKYAELGLSEAKLQLLHTYFRCFSNLYGVISVRDAWDVFKHYEGLVVHRKDFAAFSSVVQREADLPYSVYELREIYRGESADSPLDRLIVNKDLVLPGHNRFIYIYATEKEQGEKPYYLPEKAFFLTFTEDQFYLTPQGRDMTAFFKNLRTGGTLRDFNGEATGALLDIYGNPVAGKRLSDFLYRTELDQFEIDHGKRESEKRRLEAVRETAADWLLERVRIYTMTGGIFANQSPGEEINFWLKWLSTDLDVSLSDKHLERFLALYERLNNYSHLWLNCGWSPIEMFRGNAPASPPPLSLGRN